MNFSSWPAGSGHNMRNWTVAICENSSFPSDAFSLIDVPSVQIGLVTHQHDGNVLIGVFVSVFEPVLEGSEGLAAELEAAGADGKKAKKLERPFRAWQFECRAHFGVLRCEEKRMRNGAGKGAKRAGLEGVPSDIVNEERSCGSTVVASCD